jgi:hypothetical protein
MIAYPVRDPPTVVPEVVSPVQPTTVDTDDELLLNDVTNTYQVGLANGDQADPEHQLH